MVVLQARDPIEALRLKPPRLAVIRRGKVIAEAAERASRLSLEGRPDRLDPADYAPAASG
jgi:cytosine deaminase